MGTAPLPTKLSNMTKLEILLDSQIEALVGGMSGWAFPSLTSKSSSMEINNLISQSNVGSAWASSASASGSGFGGWGKFMKKPEGGVTAADATNIQKNFNSVNNFGFSITI
jgi:hypothetical protein